MFLVNLTSKNLPGNQEKKNEAMKKNELYNPTEKQLYYSIQFNLISATKPVYMTTFLQDTSIVVCVFYQNSENPVRVDAKIQSTLNGLSEGVLKQPGNVKCVR